MTSSPPPLPATSISARGAATPEDALKQSIQAAMAENARQLVELAPPSELQVVHDIGDVIAADGPKHPALG